MSVDEQALPPTSSSRPGFFAKPTSRKVAAIVSGASLALGIGMGANSTNGSAQAELESLTSQLSAIEDENIQLAAEVDHLTKSNKSLENTSSTKSATIATLTKDLQDTKADLELTTERIEELETAAQRPTPISAPVAPKSVYYKNCPEARKAGVTPIYRGQPGYATHLDRDRDGIACE